MSIVTISRELGSGGAYIGIKLAEALGGTCIEKEILHEIAQKMGRSQEDLADFDQETYNRIGVFFQEALSSIAKGGRVFHPFGIGPLDWDGVEMFTPYPSQEFKEEEYIDVLKQVMHEAAKRGPTVFLGRGGSQIFKDFSGAVHVRLVAAKKDRVERVMAEQNIVEEQANELIEQRDEAARKFLLDFFDVEWNDPLQYHLVLNTSRLSPEACIHTILELLPKE